MAAAQRPRRALALWLAALGVLAALVAARCLRWNDQVVAPTSTETGAASSAGGHPAVVSDPGPAPGVAAAGSDWSFQTVLLPGTGGGARPGPARIGIGRITQEDAAAFRAWQSGGGEGAGPPALAELAQVESWVEARIERLSDGRVQLGPVVLPAADRYDLEAAGDGPLLYYRARFTQAHAPAEVAPLVAAGVAIGIASGADTAETVVLLRRVAEAGEADQQVWQDLLAAQAPALLAAYGETPLPLPADGLLAPLPPGPVDVQVQVRGVLAASFRPTLKAGSIEPLMVNAVQAGVAAALGVTLELRLVAAGSGEPIGNVQVRWTQEGQEDRLATSTADGWVAFAGVERLRTQAFDLEFPTPERADVLPRWPLHQRIALTLDAPPISTPQTGTERRIVEIVGLQWLELDAGALPLGADRRGGQPYPIFVLQEETDTGFVDRSADHFLPRRRGLAVSTATPGRYRVAAHVSPWCVRWSSVADTRIARADDLHPVRLTEAGGRSVTLVLRQGGRSLANATVLVPGNARGLPPVSLRADAEGRLTIEQVTVPMLRLEVAGAAQVQVRMDAPRIEVEIPPPG